MIEELKKKILEKKEIEKENSFKEVLFNEVKSIKEEIKNIKTYKEVEVLNFPKQKDFPKSFDISNFPKQKEFPNEIRISNFPEQKEFPESISVKRPEWFSFDFIIKALSDIKNKIADKITIDLSEYQKPRNAIAVKLIATNGKEYNAGGGGGTSYGLSKEESQAIIDIPDILENINGFNIPKHDYISLGYTGDNLTSVIYKLGGSGGTTVGTLILAYNVDKLTSITLS